MHVRNVAVVVAALLPAFAGARDLGPGTWEIAGGTDLELSSTTLEPPGSPDEETRIVALDTTVQYYPVTNFGIGLLLDYENLEREIAGVTDEITTTMIGPLATFNIPVAQSVSAVVGGGIVRLAIDTDGNDADGFGFVVGGGLRFFATRNIAFDTTLTFVAASVEDDFNNEADISGFDLGVGISVYFGG